MSRVVRGGEFDLVTLGEAMALFAAEEVGPLSAATRFKRYCAGAELNVAIGMARLGFRVGYLSRIGDDSFGSHLLAALAREGIDTALVAVDDVYPTGFMLKSRAEDGDDPKVEYHRKGSAASHMDLGDLQRLSSVPARHLHITGISAALSEGCRELVFGAIHWARTRGMTLSFDPNLRPQLWPSFEAMVQTINELAGLCDVVLPGIAEGRLLTGLNDADGIASFYMDRGAKGVVVKLGPRGAWCASRAGGNQLVPGIAVSRVVDTVGAGDGFAVGVISALLEGHSLSAAALRGNAIGARVVQFPGDSDGLPRRHELEEQTP